MGFPPVRTKADLDCLDEGDIVEGYRSAERGDPEPGENRGRSFWHGWRNRMIDKGELPKDEAAEQLARDIGAAAIQDKGKTV
jgi:hypothetical protein